MSFKFGCKYFFFFFQGKPVGTPDPGSYFRMLQQHNIVAMFVAPTALRAVDKEVRLSPPFFFKLVSMNRTNIYLYLYNKKSNLGKSCIKFFFIDCRIHRQDMVHNTRIRSKLNMSVKLFLVKFFSSRTCVQF